MFENGSIVHIPKYEFDDGETKDTGKFLVVIYNDSGVSILAGLTGSQDHVPDDMKNHGCLDDYSKRISCHFFEEQKVICTNKYSFSKDTFIYFAGNIFDVQIKKLEDKYGGTMQHKGILREEEYVELVYCIYKSKFVKKAVKTTLEKHLENIHR